MYTLLYIQDYFFKVLFKLQTRTSYSNHTNTLFALFSQHFLESWTLYSVTKPYLESKYTQPVLPTNGIFSNQQSFWHIPWSVWC